MDIIEAGFPISSDGDFEAVRTIAGAVRRPIIAGLARAIPADIDRAWAALSQAARPRIHVFLATSDIHLEHKLRITRAQCLEQVVSTPWRTRARIATTSSFRRRMRPAPTWRFLCEVAVAAVNAGATTINLPDTVGYALPADIEKMFTTVGQADRRSRRAVGALPQRSRHWPSPTRSRRSRPAPARSSAPSTASASAPAMRRSKKS